MTSRAPSHTCTRKFEVTWSGASSGSITSARRISVIQGSDKLCGFSSPCSATWLKLASEYPRCYHHRNREPTITRDIYENSTSANLYRDEKLDRRLSFEHCGVPLKRPCPQLGVPFIQYWLDPYCLAFPGLD